ncbi:MAG: NAD-dependent epimerase/dehydratase family protein [Rhodobacteraceae bacterium]|nr:NAD-dependent epimerase/dehydratase family protein [Paracoccaceae bacterium]
MGEVVTPITVMITGAAGFIGSRCVDQARDRGHRVVAVVRGLSAVCHPWQDNPFIEIVVGDLATPEGAAQVATALDGVDAVIHAAASLSGDDAKHARDTLVATSALVDAIAARPAAGKRLVLISSIVVYDTASLNPGSVLDETTPIETHPDSRDTYCRNKLAQEAIALKAAEARELDLCVMRPGAVFGPNRIWNSHLGPVIGPILLRIGGRGQIPITYVDHCVTALILAAEQPFSGVETYNIIDDNPPDRTVFLQCLPQTALPRYIIPISWRLLAAAAALFSRLPGLRNHLPGLLRPAVVRARMMPLSYSNTKAKNALGWRPGQSLQTAMLHATAQDGGA